MRCLKNFILTAYFTAWVGAGKILAQKTTWFQDASAPFHKAVELYQNQRYAPALGLFNSWLESPVKNFPEFADAHYYRAACAYHLDHSEALNWLRQFIREFPHHPYCARAQFLAGMILFRSGRFGPAFQSFQLADPAQLLSEEKALRTFYSAYCLFQMKQYDRALPLLDAAAVSDNPLHWDALYYRGHIFFEKARWEAALKDFKQVETHPPYNRVAPYYIAQIYYRRKEYDKAGSYARQVADTARGKYLLQMLAIWAESDFRTAQYHRAAEAFERLEAAGATLDPPQAYRYGISLLKAGRYDAASEKLSRVASGQDSLAQNAAYHLAEALILAGRKKEALQAFKTAWKLGHDKNMAEDALFNFAKLAYELDFDPYHEAIKALQSYLEAYPNSPRSDELYTFLSEIYMGTRNYKEALEALGKIKNKTRKIREAFQRTAFLKAVEQFNMGNFNEAIRYFNISATYPESEKLMAESVYWTGESFYRVGKIKEAFEAFEEFRLMLGTRSSELYPLAVYNLAYIQFRQSKYKEASVLFRQFLELENAPRGRRYTDALLRTGDCFYAQRNYDEALRYYEWALQAPEKEKFEEDYALLQKAVVYGILNKPREKLAALDTLLERHPRSVYLAEALYDNGNTRLRLGETGTAEAHFKRIIQDFPQSRLRPKAMLKLGLIAYNKDDNAAALGLYKNVLEQYPGSSEASEALRYVRNIYVEEGKMEEFTQFLGRVKGVSLSEGALDSASYQSAENRMLKGDCAGAIEGFTRYLNTYPQGVYALSARYFRGECLQKAGRSSEALNDMEQVANASANAFTENALYAAASIALADKNCLRAAPFLERLEKISELQENTYYAVRNLMLCAYLSGDYSRAAEFGKKVLDNPKAPQTDEEIAWMALGYAHLLKSDTAEAEKYFQRTAQRHASYYAPEAKYQICRILYLKKQYETCEKKILDWANSLSAQRKWLAKMYILLGETYAARQNYFQAKATFQSIVDNHDGPEEVAEARQKLAQIGSLEKSHETLKQEKDEE